MMINLYSMQNQSGFTLLEVLIAVAILTIGILSVNAMQVTSINGNSSANNMTKSTNLASDYLEKMLNMPFDSGTNGTDDDGDGATDEPDEKFDDGTGANNGSAGLDDNGLDDDNDGAIDEAGELFANRYKPFVIGSTDGFVPSSDGKYNVFWNVADNYPQNNMKTIRVFVQNNSATVKTVSFTNCKINF